MSTIPPDFFTVPCPVCGDDWHPGGTIGDLLQHLESAHPTLIAELSSYSQGRRIWACCCGHTAWTAQMILHLEAAGDLVDHFTAALLDKGPLSREMPF